jgi:uncharacterized protein YqeY
MEAALAAAIRARDPLTTSTLRAALGALANAEAVDPATMPTGTTEVPRRELTAADIAAVLRQELSELQGALDACRRHGRAAEAAELRQRRAILEGYLASDA